MKNLGKIILFLTVVPLSLSASVVASVNETSVVVGDMVTYSLTISGENVKKPQINRLCDVDILSSASQTSIQMINNDYTKNYVLSYQFMPQKSCSIPSMQIEIDGKIQRSNSIKIEVKELSSAAAKDADFLLSLTTSKEEMYVGEPFELVMLLKQKLDAEAVDSKFVAPELKGFWVKSESKPERFVENGYTLTKVRYTLSPQREGEIKITPAQLRIAQRSDTREIWGSWAANVKWRTYFSNELNLKVKPLPEGISLVGNFTLEALTDKDSINVQEPLNLTIKVKGEGNLEDIKTFKSFINGVSIFDEKIMIENSVLSQKMAFVAENNFTIPPFELKFFDPKTKEIKTITTKEIHIHVKNAKPEEKPLLKKGENLQEKPLFTATNKPHEAWLALAFVLGLASGIALALLRPWRFFSKKSKSFMKDPKTLLVKLLPYKNDEKVRQIIEILEKNIYEKKHLEYDKKVLKACLKKYAIS